MDYCCADCCVPYLRPAALGSWWCTKAVGTTRGGYVCKEACSLCCFRSCWPEGLHIGMGSAQHGAPRISQQACVTHVAATNLQAVPLTVAAGGSMHDSAGAFHTPAFRRGLPRCAGPPRFVTPYTLHGFPVAPGSPRPASAGLGLQAAGYAVHVTPRVCTQCHKPTRCHQAPRARLQRPVKEYWWVYGTSAHRSYYIPSAPKVLLLTPHPHALSLGT